MKFKMLAFELEKSRERNLKDSDEIIERLKEEALGDIHGATAGSRVKALELLMRHFNMLDQNQKIELSMKDSWFDKISISLPQILTTKRITLIRRSSQKCHPQSNLDPYLSNPHSCWHGEGVLGWVPHIHIPTTQSLFIPQTNFMGG